MKYVGKDRLRVDALSSPARGMWIEIAALAIYGETEAVIPRTGDVD